MSDFNFVPSWGSDQDVEPKVLSARFGDGYEQRVGDGINTMSMVWNLKFEDISSADADTITEFFRTKAGVTYFTWTPPGIAEAKFICRKWKRSYPNFRHTVTATLEQVFDV